MMSEVIAYSFLLYILYVLLPIIPAAIIFKMFPDSKVAVSGPLQNLSFNATGAFAAYIVTVVLGYGLIQYVESQIELQQAANWTVTVPVKFVDHQGNPMTTGLKIEDVKSHPADEPFQLGDGKMYVTIRRATSGRWPILSVHVTGFDPRKLDLPGMVAARDPASLELDQFHRTITIKDALTLTALSPHFTTIPYADSAPLKAALTPAVPPQ